MAGILTRARAAIARAIAPPAQNTRGAFAAAQWNRLTADWIFAASRSADAEIRGELRALKNRAREQLRNSPFGVRYAQLLVENVIGPNGIRLQAKNQTSEGKLFAKANSAIEQAWEEAGRPENWDVTGKLSRTESFALAMFNKASDGEILIRIYRGPQFGPFGFQIQVLDTDFLDELLNQDETTTTPRIRNGVEFDTVGKPVAYWLWKRHPFEVGIGGTMANERIRVPARDIIHAFIPMRPGQSRGIPDLAAVMTTLKMLDGYVEAELVAARTASAKMGALVDTNTDNPTAPDPNAGREIPAEADPGTLLDLRGMGARLDLWDPQHPAAAFPEFTRTLGHYVSIGLGVSYGALTGDLRDANYSSMKVGQQPERDHARRLTAFFITHVVDRLYREWLAMALLNEMIPGVVDKDAKRWTRVRWQGRGFPSPDPLKDVESDLTKVAAGVKTLTQVAAEDGYDLEELIEERKMELEMLKAAGVDSVLPSMIAKGTQNATDESAPDKGGKPAADPKAARGIARLA